MTIKFRHLHRGNDLAGTIAYEDQKDGSYLVAMTLLNPNDVRPRPKDNRDAAIEYLVRLVRATCHDEVLTNELLRMKGIPALTKRCKPAEDCSRKAGRARSLSRFQAGDSIRVLREELIEWTEAGDVVIMLGRLLNFPESVLQKCGDVR